MTWTHTWTPPLEFADISCGADATVIAVDTAGEVHRYYGAQGWVTIPGTLQQIAVGSNSDVWGIDPDGNAIQLIAPQFFEHGSIRLPQWDANDPFDETKSTHLWIVNRAVALAGQDADFGAQLLALFPPEQGRIGQAFHDNVCQGLYDADAIYNDPIVIQGVKTVPTWKSHFYNPGTRTNYFGETDPTAMTACCYNFSVARENFLGGNLAGAGYALGLALHYLTDVTQPMHAGNLTAFNSWLPGYHPAFEAYALEVQGDVRAPTTYVPPALGDTPGAYVQQAALQAMNYFISACPPNIITNFLPGTDSWKRQVEPVFAPLLLQAIQITSQFLVVWLRSTQIHTDWVDGNTAGVTMIVPTTPSFGFSPNAQYPLGSFTAKAGQPYKVTTCCNVLPAGSAPAGVYLSVSAGNAVEAQTGAAVIMGTNWRPALMQGFLVASADGDVPLTMTTGAGDLSGTGSVMGIRIIIETMSA